MNEAKLKTKLHLRMVLIAMALAFPFWVLLLSLPVGDDYRLDKLKKRN